MTFLNPFMLFGLLAAGIPIIIHLFNFRKPKKIDFSSLEFLRELEKSAMRRVKIQQWLLLALRILAIISLVLAFAEPILEGALGEGRFARTATAIVVDNSQSMTVRDTRGEYLDQAKSAASQLVEAAPAGDGFYVLETASDGGNRSYFRNKAPLLERINEIEARPGARSLARAMRQAALQLDEIENRNKEIYLITDMQRSTLLDSLNNRLPEDATLILVPIGDRQPVNAGVTDVRIESRIVEAGQPVKMLATFRNFGDEKLENFAVSVYLEGERAAQAVTTLDPNGTSIVPLVVTPQRRGWLSGEVRIEDDAFSNDNVRFFTLHVPDTRRVLLVRGAGQNVRYLDLALSADLTRGRVVFNIDKIDEQNLAATSLPDYDVVILAGPQNLSSGEIATIQQFVSGGGGLLVLPHDQAVVADYNALFSAVGGGRVLGYNGAKGADATLGRFDRVDREHPLFEGVFEDAVPGASVESPDVKFAVRYTAGTGNEQALIRLTDGSSFLQEIRYQQGRTLLLSVAADPAWSDLPLRGLFVPLLFRSMYYLSAGSAGSSATTEDGEVLVSGATDGGAIRLVGPDGNEFAPVQRAMFGAIALDIGNDIKQAGIYDVVQDDRVLRKVAINVNSEESDLAMLSDGEASEMLKQSTGRDVVVMDPRAGGQVRMDRALSAQKVGIELWNVFLWAALFFLVLEMFVAMRWRQKTPGNG